MGLPISSQCLRPPLHTQVDAVQVEPKRRYVSREFVQPSGPHGPPQPLRSSTMTLALPDEVWSLVAGHVAREAETAPTNAVGMRVRARQPGEQWQMLADRHERVHPLMVMARVCRRWRRIATAMLWTNVVLDIHDDYDSMDLLIQLSEALQAGSMAARCIATINIDVRRTLDESRMLAMDQMEEEFERIMQEDCGNTTAMPDLAAFDATLDRLGRCLAKCDRLVSDSLAVSLAMAMAHLKCIDTLWMAR